MKIRFIDREVVDGRPRLTIQTKRWWQWSWRTEVWLRSIDATTPCNCISGGRRSPHYWWTSDGGSILSCDDDKRLSRINDFAENEEKRTVQLVGAEFRDARTKPN